MVNNLFYQEAGHGSAENANKVQMLRNSGELEGNNVVDYNLYFHEEGEETYGGWNGDLGGVATIEAWRNTTGFDLHSLSGVDPLFLSIADPHLQADSPARGGGQ